MTAKVGKAGPTFRVPLIDGVRFVAAALVMFYHLAFWTEFEPSLHSGTSAAAGLAVHYPQLVQASWFGWIGVQIFFVVSGYVIAFSADGRSMYDFARSRMLRLLPLIWVTAPVVLLVTALYSETPIGHHIPEFIRMLIVFPIGPWLDGVYWSLGVEVVFYALIGMLLLTNNYRHIESVAEVVIGFNFLLWILTILLEWLAPGTWLSLDLWRFASSYGSRILLLSSGGGFGLGIVLFVISRLGITPRRIFALAVAFAAVNLEIYRSAQESAAVALHNAPSWLPCIVWSAAIVTIAAAILRRRDTSSTLTSGSFLVSLGLASYPLYLTHNIIGAYALGRLVHAGIDPDVALLATCCACVALSYGLARLVEAPVRNVLRDAFDFLESAAQTHLPHILALTTRKTLPINGSKATTR